MSFCYNETTLTEIVTCHVTEKSFTNTGALLAFAALSAAPDAALAAWRCGCRVALVNNQ